MIGMTNQIARADEWQDEIKCDSKNSSIALFVKSIFSFGFPSPSGIQGIYNEGCYCQDLQQMICK